VIRAATRADAPAIGAIWNRVIRESTSIFASTERTEAEIADLARQDFWVWDEGGRILGFARFFPFRAGNGYAHTVEHTILVAPEAHGRGVGRALMEHLIARAAEAGKHSLWAAVTGENEAGVAFHRSLGFVEHARLPEVGRKFGRWHDVVLMGLRLPSADP
jgi:L-amino acid N-acyltransferase YncA